MYKTCISITWFCDAGNTGKARNVDDCKRCVRITGNYRQCERELKKGNVRQMCSRLYTNTYSTLDRASLYSPTRIKDRLSL